MEKEGIMIPNNENFHGFKQFLAISKEIGNKEHVPNLVEIHSGYPRLSFLGKLKPRSNHYDFEESKTRKGRSVKPKRVAESPRHV
jgi:hypothetical protein